MKEKIILSKTEDVLKEVMLIQKEQLALDKAKLELAELRKLVRSKSQLIPERLRRLKLQ